MVVLYSRGKNCESNHWRGTTGECHKEWTSGKLLIVGQRSCKNWTWCRNPLICQPFTPHLTYYYLPTGKSFRSGKREVWIVCHNSIRNITNNCFIFYAIIISIINCIKPIDRTFHILDWILIHIDGLTE